MSQENIEQKLAYLDETKQLIKEAIINKGQTLSDETPFRDYVQKISDIETGPDLQPCELGTSSETESKVETPPEGYYFSKVIVHGDEDLIPENIKSGVNIFGVDGTLQEGVDTSDATATSSDIIAPKTAYVNGKSVVGNIKTIEKISEDYISHLVKNITTNTNIVYWDSYTLDNRTFLAYIEGSEIKCLAIYNDNVVASLTFPSSSLSTTLQAFAVNLVSVNSTNIWFAVGTAYTSGSQDYYKFIKIIWNTSKDTLTQSVTASCNWGGKSSSRGTLWAVKNVPNRFATISKNNSDDYMAYVTTNFSGSSASASVKYADVWHGYHYNPEARVSGNGQWLIQNAFVMYMNPNTTTMTSYSNPIGINVSISANNKYIWGSNVLYKTTPNTNFTTLYNSRVKFKDLTATNVYFSLDEQYLYAKTTTGIQIYKITETDIVLMQDIKYANCSMLMSNDGANFFISDKNLLDINYHYIPSTSLVLEGLIKDGQNFIRLDAQSVPEASNVLENSKFKNEYGDIIEGTMPNNGTLDYNSSQEDQTIPEGYTAGGTIKAVTSSIDENIKAENIKEGISILGITGTLSEGESFEGSHSIYTLKWNNIKDSYANNISLYSKNLIFNVPIEANTYPTHLCFLSPKDDGTYERYIVLSNCTYVYYLAYNFHEGYVGDGNQQIDIQKIYKYKDISDITTIEDYYGFDEIGIECQPEDIEGIKIEMIGDSTWYYYRVFNTTNNLAGYYTHNIEKVDSYENGGGSSTGYDNKINPSMVKSNTIFLQPNGALSTGTLDISNCNFVNFKGCSINNYDDNSSFNRNTTYRGLTPSISLKNKYWAIIQYDMQDPMMPGSTNIIIVSDDHLPITFDYAEGSGRSVLQIDTDSSNNYKWYYYKVSTSKDYSTLQTCIFKETEYSPENLPFYFLDMGSAIICTNQDITGTNESGETITYLNELTIEDIY